jgi:hypothetical protein
LAVPRAHTVFVTTTNPHEPFPHPDVDLRFSNLGLCRGAAILGYYLGFLAVLSRRTSTVCTVVKTILFPIFLFAVCRHHGIGANHCPADLKTLQKKKIR